MCGILLHVSRRLFYDTITTEAVTGLYRRMVLEDYNDK